MSLVPRPETTAAVHQLFRFPSYGAAAILSQDSVERGSTLLGTRPTFLTKTSNSTSIVIFTTLTSFYFAESGGHKNAVVSQATLSLLAPVLVPHCRLSTPSLDSFSTLTKARIPQSMPPASCHTRVTMRNQIISITHQQNIKCLEICLFSKHLMFC